MRKTTLLKFNDINIPSFRSFFRAFNFNLKTCATKSGWLEVVWLGSKFSVILGHLGLHVKVINKPALPNLLTSAVHHAISDAYFLVILDELMVK